MFLKKIRKIMDALIGYLVLTTSVLTTVVLYLFFEETVSKDDLLLVMKIYYIFIGVFLVIKIIINILSKGKK